MALDRSTVKSIAMVFMIVSSSLLAPVGGAAAQVPAAQPAPEAGECTNLDDFVMFLSLGQVNADSCSRQAYVDAAVSDMKASDANQSKVDIYVAAQQQAAGEEAFMAPMENYLQDTESVAWMKAESAIAESYANGESKAAAKANARAAISEYYNTKAINLIEQWNSTVAAHQTMRSQAVMEDGIGSNYVAAQIDKQSHNIAYGSTSYGNTTISLPNGTNHGVRTLTANPNPTDSTGSSSDAGPITAHVANNAAENGNDWDSDGYFHGLEYLTVAPPNTYDEPARFGDTRKYTELWNQIDLQHSTTQSEAANFVDATWQDYETGQINASDVLSANTAMSEYGVRSANESEGLWRSTAALSMMGYDTPDLNNSGMMTVEYRNQNLTGLLMARNAPNGTWEVNTTYNTSNIDGPVFMTTTDGKKIDFADGEEFEVVAMTAKDGSQLNSTATTKYRYKTANTSELLEVQNQLMDLREEIEEREPDAGGSFNIGSTDTMLVGLLALAGALLMMQNQNRGGRR